MRHQLAQAHNPKRVGGNGSNGTLTWLANDGQNSTQLAINPDTGAFTQQRYTPFGTQRGTQGPPDGSQHAYLGHDYDPDTGLLQDGARMYDPGLARFISPDPIVTPGDPQNLNAYSYSINNPMTFSDPSGLSAGCSRDPEDCGGGGDRTNGNPGANPPPSPSKQGCSRDPSDCANQGGAEPSQTTAQKNYLEGQLRLQIDVYTKTGYHVDNPNIITENCILDISYCNLILRSLEAGMAPDVALAELEHGDTNPAEYYVGALAAGVAGEDGEFVADGSNLAAPEIAQADGELSELTAPPFRDDTSHIFRNARGHFAVDTPESRGVIQSAISPANLRSTTTLPDGSTVDRYFLTLPDGTQAWAEVRNGQITNGGLNQTPR